MNKYYHKNNLLAENQPLLRKCCSPRQFLGGIGLLKSCLRCGRRFIRTGHAFTINCVEGRAVEVSICRACAKAIAKIVVVDFGAPLRPEEGSVAA